MRLTAQTDYALRMLMQIGVNDPDLVTITEVAKRYDLSKNHLMKVSQMLTQLGVLTSVRGRNGGLRLARPAGEISVGKVVRHLESGGALVECFQANGNNCLVSPACRLKSVLNEAMEAFYAVLDTYSIGDLIHQNPDLADILQGAA